MNEFIDMVKTLGGQVSKIAEKLKVANELFPNNLLVNTIGDFIEKRSKEPSILSQDEEIFGTKSFLRAIDHVEREYLEKKQAEKREATKRAAQGKGKVGKDFDPTNPWNLQLDATPTPPSQSTSAQEGVITGEGSKIPDLKLKLGTGKAPEKDANESVSLQGTTDFECMFDQDEYDNIFGNNNVTLDDILGKPKASDFQYQG